LHEEQICTDRETTKLSRTKIKVDLKKGNNIIKFSSKEGCQSPSEIQDLDSRDARCISFAFQNIRLLPPEGEKFDYLDYPLKLNLGCGFDIRPGYLNIDLNEFHSPDLTSDIVRLDNLPSDIYEEILAQDCLEHLKRSNVKLALKEWFRLLRKGGILKIRVPNLLGLLESLKIENSHDKREWIIQCIFGTQAYNGDYHLSGFTPPLLKSYLLNSGFTGVNFASKETEWVIIVEAKK
jgi:SAM-dependent methyltransferase